MKYLFCIYAFVIIAAMSCGGEASSTKPMNQEVQGVEKSPDPWISEERWNIGNAPCAFSLPRQEWSSDQIQIHKVVEEAAYEFYLFQSGDVAVVDIVTSQESCDRRVKRAMECKPIAMDEGDFPLDLKPWTTRRLRDQIMAEPHPVPIGDNPESYFEEDNMKKIAPILDLLFHCDESRTVHRIVKIDVKQTEAIAIVEVRGGSMDNKDTIIDGKEYSIPEFRGGFCPSTRFDLVKTDGKWLIDHREILTGTTSPR